MTVDLTMSKSNLSITQHNTKKSAEYSIKILLRNISDLKQPNVLYATIILQIKGSKSDEYLYSFSSYMGYTQLPSIGNESLMFPQI